MRLRIISGDYTVCKPLKVEFPAKGVVFFARTDDELSLVCQSRFTPESSAREDGWNMLRIEEGALDFSLTGVLAGLTDVLAKAKIGIFAVSTFNTDYLLVKAAKLEAAVDALESAGYTFVQGDFDD